MTTKKFIEEIDSALTLKNLTQTYQEVSIMKMKKIRTSVLQSRDFMENLTEVFANVQGSYKREFEELIKKRKQNKGQNQSKRKYPDQSVSVLLTTNTKLYGNITNEVFRKFLQESSERDSRKVIVGKVGKEMYQRARQDSDFEYFEIPDNTFDTDQLKEIIVFVTDYGEVEVYHGQYQSLMQQEAIATKVAGDSSELLKQQGQADQTNTSNRFLFEPSIDSIIDFFEVQVFVSLFRQTVFEANLANLGSRITAMESASSNIDDRLRELNRQKRKAKKAFAGKKQREFYGQVKTLLK